MLRRGWMMALALWGGVVSAQTVELAIEDDWLPFAGVREGQLRGVSPQIIRAAYASVGVRVRFTPMPFTRCMQSAQRGVVAGCIESIRNPDIESAYVWHRTPIFESAALLYVRADSALRYTGIESLRGRRIGVTNGYEYGPAFDGFDGLTRDVANTDLQTLRKLAAGRVEAAPVYAEVFAYLLAKHPDLRDRFKAVGTLHTARLFVAFAPGRAQSATLAAQLDQGLANIARSGFLARCLSTCNPDTPQHD